jgi:hypothetical protein
MQFVNGLANETSRYLVQGRVPRVDLVPVYWPNETYSFQDSGMLLASFGILGVEQGYWDDKIKWQDAKITDLECALEFCGQVYQSVCEQGTLQETLTTTDFDRVASSFEPPSTQAQSIMDGMNDDFGHSLAYLGQKAYFYTSSTIVVNRTDSQLSLSNTVSVLDSVHKTFNITQKAITTISSFLTENSTLQGITYSLSDSINLSATFETAARMLSNRFRDIDGSVASGTTQQGEIYTHVAWVYFYVPAAILGFGVIFSLGVAFQSYHQKMENMKSNTMETLLHGLDSDTRELLKAEKKGGIERKKVIVRLHDERNGFNLRSGN